MHPLSDEARPAALRSMLAGSLAFFIGPAVGLATAPILARCLKPAGRGQLAALLQPLTVAEAFVGFGVPAACVYFTARGGSPQQIFRHALRSGLLPLFLTLIALGLYAPTLAAKQGLPMLLVGCIWAFAAVDYAIVIRRGTVQGMRKWRELNLERAGQPLLRLVGFSVLSLLGSNMVSHFALWHISAIAAAAAVFLFYRVRLPEEGAPPTPPAFRRYALTSGVGSVTLALNNRLDQAVFPMALSAPALGNYAVAVTIAEVPTLFSAMTARNLVSDRSAGASPTHLRATAAFGLLSTWTSAGLLALIAAPLTHMVFGAAFAPAIAATQILCAGVALGAVATLGSALLMGAGRPGLASAIPGSGVIATLALITARFNSMTLNDAAWISVWSQAASAVAAAALLLYTRYWRRSP